MVTLRVKTHGREEFIVKVEDYDANELNEQCNNNALTTVCVGDVVISRINIESISIIEDEPTESAE